MALVNVFQEMKKALMEGGFSHAYENRFSYKMKQQFTNIVKKKKKSVVKL